MVYGTKKRKVFLYQTQLDELDPRLRGDDAFNAGMTHLIKPGHVLKSRDPRSTRHYRGVGSPVIPAQAGIQSIWKTY